MQWYDYFGLFVLLYPGIMAAYWTISALLYFLIWENRDADDTCTNTPPVSVLIPCFNEARNLQTSIPHLLNLDYPDYELIFIDDGSTDDTLPLIRSWAQQHDRIRVLHQAKLRHSTTVCAMPKENISSASTAIPSSTTAHCHTSYKVWKQTPISAG